jgi:hypothetical protein
LVWNVWKYLKIFEFFADPCANDRATNSSLVARDSWPEDGLTNVRELAQMSALPPCANERAGWNPKYEALNPRQIQITKIQNSKQNFSHKCASEIRRFSEKTSGNRHPVTTPELSETASGSRRAETTPQVSIKCASILGWRVGVSHWILWIVIGTPYGEKDLRQEEPESIYYWLLTIYYLSVWSWILVSLPAPNNSSLLFCAGQAGWSQRDSHFWFFKRGWVYDIMRPKIVRIASLRQAQDKRAYIVLREGLRLRRVGELGR